ncbi:MAG: TonB-dependent receptor [Bacteroidetes bacterium]|nr:TonB-dependent receptor [Bacteroidota bacterium]
MKLLLLLFFIALYSGLYAQISIKGKVTDSNNEPLTGVNVYFKSSYDGASSDETGKYHFKTELSGKQTMVVSFIGFKTIEQLIDLDTAIGSIDFIMRKSSNRLDAVVITAGSFEASDEKKAVIFKPLDIVTTAGGLADIPSVINTLPGTQTVGEEGKLFVRGGDSYETRTFIDGMIVDEPYGSTVPDVPARGRFSPFLFKGMLFSSGGYSAEYGQALSSALVLETNDLAPETVTSLSLMSVGLGAAHTQRWDRASLSLSTDYFNLAPYFGLIKQQFDWQSAPGGFGGSMAFRQKTGKNGMVKIYSQYGKESSSLLYPAYTDPAKEHLVQLVNDNLYVNATYRDIMNEKLISNAGISYTNNTDDIKISSDHILEEINNLEFRYNLNWLISEEFKIKFGGDLWGRKFNQKFDFNSFENPVQNDLNDLISSGFIESEVKLTHTFAARFGSRVEYSTWLERWNIAPRLSLAYKTGKNSQVSLAWGTFYQSPENTYLVHNHNLRFEKAAHYILNYQLMKNKKTFRIEAYFKDYKNLVKYDSLYLPVPESYNNKGKGYAKGIDLFWRDNSNGNIDYWISYAYIDSRREYKDYPVMATPTFVSEHNLTVVFKNYVPKISTQIGLTYKIASGRPYYNPTNPNFLADRTKIYNDLSFNFSYLTHLWDHFTIVHCSVSNVLGSDHTFGYRFSLNPDEQGEYDSMAIKPGAKRFLFLGIFVSI